MNAVNSKRKYQVVTPPITYLGEAGFVNLTIDEIANPKPTDWEVVYALNELVGIDRILDMKVLDVIEFRGNRDNEDEDNSILIRVR